MQLFILSAIVVYVLWHKKNIGMALLVFLFIGTIAANFVVFAVFNLMPTLMPTRTYMQIIVSTMLSMLYVNFSIFRMDTIAMGTNADYFYTKPWTRAPPYVIGVWLGWFLYATEESQKRIFNKVNILQIYTVLIIIL